ncbi:unannotated protein [freshwater metagenome]|uniref:Unannotated protein n=1 Tax=freshwater metagenome TaxID=449393 RepID=A0A6J7DXL9_9ZZZZ|nr:DUF916 domain-containing protein [Actinomycetota bacterium]
MWVGLGLDLTTFSSQRRAVEWMRRVKQGSSLRLTLTLLAAGVAGALIVPMSAPAQAADNGAWSAAPTQQGSFAGRQFFFEELAPGATVKDSITVKNASAAPLDLDVYSADAFNVEAGAGFALRKRGETNTDVGSWITVGKTKIVLQPGQKGNVPFTLTVPRGVTPGDHAGGVVTIEPAPTPTGDSSQLLIQRALGVRVYVRVAGPLSPRLTVTNVDLAVKPARLPFVGQQGGATVTYTVKNSGNVRLTANRQIVLKGIFGNTLHDTGTGPIPEILPGSTVRLTENFSGMPVLDRVTANLVLSEKTNNVKSAGQASAWSISWVFLFLLLLLILGTLGAIWWSRLGTAASSPVSPAAGPTTQPETEQP